MTSTFIYRGRERLDDVLIYPDASVLRILMSGEVADQARYQSHSLMAYFKKEENANLLMDAVCGRLVLQLKTPPGDNHPRASFVPYSTVAAEIPDLDAENARELRRVAYNALQLVNCGNIMLNALFCKPGNLEKLFSIPVGPVKKSRFFCWIMSKAFHTVISINPRELIGYLVENPSKVRDILSRSDSTELYQVLIRIATSLEDGTGAQVLYDEKIQEVLFNKFVGASSVKEASITSKTICDFIGNSRSSNLIVILFDEYFQAEKLAEIYNRMLAVKSEHLPYAFAIVVETINYFKGNTKVESMTEEQFVNILANFMPLFKKVIEKGQDQKCGQIRSAVIPIIEFLLQSKSESVYKNATSEKIFDAIWISCVHYSRNSILHAAVCDMIKSTYGKSNPLADNYFESVELLERLTEYRKVRTTTHARSEFAVFFSKIAEHAYNSFKEKEVKPAAWSSFIGAHENMIAYWDGGSKSSFPEDNQIITYGNPPQKLNTPTETSSPAPSTAPLNQSVSIPSLKLSSVDSTEVPQEKANDSTAESTQPHLPPQVSPISSPPANEQPKKEEQSSEKSNIQTQEQTTPQPSTSSSQTSPSEGSPAPEKSHALTSHGKSENVEQAGPSASQAPKKDKSSGSSRKGASPRGDGSDDQKSSSNKICIIL